MDSFSNLPTWLPALVKAKSLSVTEFCSLVGITRQSYYNYITDANRPDTETMSKICKVLGVHEAEGLMQYSIRPVGRKPDSTNQLQDDALQPVQNQ